MKKIIFALALLFSFTIGALAQTDGFFSNWNDIDDDRNGNNVVTPGLPTTHNTNNNYDAPLDCGLLIFTALGAGYAIISFNRKKTNHE